MQRTIFTTPVIKTICRWLACFILILKGWKITGDSPEVKKYVMIAVPHTTNWDFFYGLLMILYFKDDVHWMGKKQLFRFPFGGLMKWFGGIPVDRSRTNNLVQAVVDEYNKSDSLVITISPEGSRSKVDSWKTGFYYIAKGAGVPILPAFLDYEKRTGGYGELFTPTGDMMSDMMKIMEFYKDKRGKHEDR